MASRVGWMTVAGVLRGNGSVTQGFRLGGSRCLATSATSQSEARLSKAELAKLGPSDFERMTDGEVLDLVKAKVIPSYKLEAVLKDLDRAVMLRRMLVEEESKRPGSLADLAHEGYEYSSVHGACCENVVGYCAIPVGISGPLNIDGEMVHVPMATTEGVLVASTHRGMSALNKCGGVRTMETQAGGMTRAPLVRLPTATEAVAVKNWIEEPQNYVEVAAAFNSTSRFGRLVSITPILAGRNLYLRFRSKTGDAMGMNMVSKGVEEALRCVKQYFPNLEVCSVSGNVCTDKKSSAVNWTMGRGQSVIAEAVLTKNVVESVLKSSVKHVMELNVNKNLIGSAMAGTLGGFNAHAANIVAAIFIATGQDPAQVVESSSCITQFEENEDGSMYCSVSMPSIEVGTVGGGTHLPSQRAALRLLGISGSHTEAPGGNSKKLARVVAASVLAGELSLMSALAAGHLVRAHMEHNRR